MFTFIVSKYLRNLSFCLSTFDDRTFSLLYNLELLSTFDDRTFSLLLNLELLSTFDDRTFSLLLNLELLYTVMSSCPQKYHSQFYLKFKIFNFLVLFLKMIIRMDVRLLEVFCNVYTCVVKCRRILSSKLFCLLILPLLFRRPFLFMTTTTTTMISDCNTLYVYFIFRQTSLLLQLQRTSTVQAQNSCSEWKSIGKIWF